MRTISIAINMMIVHSKPNRARRVDEIGQRASGLADHVDLGVERARARRELILVLKPRIEPFEVRPVPEHVRLVVDGDAA